MTEAYWFQIRILFMIHSIKRKKDIRRALTKRHLVFYPLCMKKGVIRKHAYYTSGCIQKIKQKMQNGDQRKGGDKTGGTLLSVIL